MSTSSTLPVRDLPVRDLLKALRGPFGVTGIARYVTDYSNSVISPQMVSNWMTRSHPSEPLVVQAILQIGFFAMSFHMVDIAKDVAASIKKIRFDTLPGVGGLTHSTTASLQETEGANVALMYPQSFIRLRELLKPEFSKRLVPQGRLLAVLGGMSSGKSSLVNFCVGERVFDTSALPRQASGLNEIVVRDLKVWEVPAFMGWEATFGAKASLVSEIICAEHCVALVATSPVSCFNDSGGGGADSILVKYLESLGAKVVLAITKADQMTPREQAEVRHYFARTYPRLPTFLCDTRAGDAKDLDALKAAVGLTRDDWSHVRTAARKKRLLGTPDELTRVLAIVEAAAIDVLPAGSGKTTSILSLEGSARLIDYPGWNDERVLEFLGNVENKVGRTISDREIEEILASGGQLELIASKLAHRGG